MKGYRPLILTLILFLALLHTSTTCSNVFASTNDKPHTRTIVVIGSLEDYPIMYADQEGQASGLAVDLINEFCNTYGYSAIYELYPNNKIDAVFKNHGNLKYTTGFTPSSNTENLYLPFYYKHYTLITHSQFADKDPTFNQIKERLTDLKEKDGVIGYVGTPEKLSAIEKLIHILPYKNYDTYSALLEDVYQNRLSYGLIPDALAEKLLKEYSYKYIHSLHTTVFSESSNFVISNQSQFLYYDLHRFIDTTKKDGRRSEWISKWFNYKPTFSTTSNIVLYVNIFAIITIGIILLMTYRTFIMQHTIDEKTKELRQQNKLNEELYSKLLRKEQFKNSYFLNLSHELRTPISVILNASQMIESTSNQSKSDESATHIANKVPKYNLIIRNNGYRLLRVITNLIDINRLDNNDYILNLSPINLVELLQKLKQELVDLEYFTESHITILHDPLQIYVQGNSHELSRVFLNLISNSAKFCDSTPAIVICIHEKDEQVIIEYSDNSQGITEEMLPELFTRFYFESSLLIKKYEGSGLGLYLVRELLSLHKGKIEAAYEHNSFSYLITLPHLPKSIPHEASVSFNTTDIKQLIRMEFAEIFKKKK